MVTLVLALASCASVPTPKADDECLVVVKSATELGQHVTASQAGGREYQLILDSNHKPVWIRADYTLIVVKTSAVSIRSISTIASHGYEGPARVFDVNVRLPYESGHVVIADYVFVKRTEKAGEGSFVTRVLLRKITETERQELENRIRQDPAFSTWKM